MSVGRPTQQGDRDVERKCASYRAKSTGHAGKCLPPHFSGETQGSMVKNLKSLAEEEYPKRDANLFGPDFLEKATKRIEVDKTMSKVSQQPAPPGNPNKLFKYSNDRADLRSFLSKGAPAQCGSRKPWRQSPLNQRKFQSRNYYQRQQKGDRPKPPASESQKQS